MKGLTQRLTQWKPKQCSFLLSFLPPVLLEDNDAYVVVLSLFYCDSSHPQRAHSLVRKTDVAPVKWLLCNH